MKSCFECHSSIQHIWCDWRRIGVVVRGCR